MIVQNSVRFSGSLYWQDRPYRFDTAYRRYNVTCLAQRTSVQLQHVQDEVKPLAVL